MSAKTRSFVLILATVLISVTIVANAEPVPVPKKLITKEEAMSFFKRHIKKNIYEPAKKQVMPILTTMVNSFTQGIQNATSAAILKGRDAYLQMKQNNEKNNDEEKGTEDDNHSSFDDTFD